MFLLPAATNYTAATCKIYGIGILPFILLLFATSLLVFFKVYERVSPWYLIAGTLVGIAVGWYQLLTQ